MGGTARGSVRKRRLLALRWFASMLAATVSVATAAQEPPGVVGDWTYGMDQGIAGASTTNAQGARFGIVCTDYCIGFIESDRACRADAEFAGMMRSTLGEEPTTLTCYRLEDHFVLTLRPTEALIDATEHGTELSFTVTLEGTEPTVFSFSLRGAYDAIYLTLAAAVDAAEDPERI